MTVGAAMATNPAIKQTIDRNIPGMPALDNFGKRYLGFGDTYEEQRQEQRALGWGYTRRPHATVGRRPGRASAFEERLCLS